MKFDIKEEDLIIKPYKSTGSIQVREQKGAYQKIRRLLSWLLIITFILIPFIQYSGQQAVLLDIENQQFRFFSVTFWPQDFILLASVFMAGAFALFFVTSWLGRVWCGYVCPQTVWTLAYIWVEHRIEGTRNQRIALDKQKHSFAKLQKKFVKHFIWLLMSVVSASTFISYFIPASSLYSDIMQLNCTGLVTFWLCFFTLCTYGNAGWLREKVCIDMCPYARFQSAMFDKNTLLVAYDKERGENRAPRKLKDDPKQLGLGDCVDCNLCVEVCPTGIDIRNGMQYECINCGLCVDACDETMSRFNYQKGLISYTSEQQLFGQKAKGLNVKVLTYGVITAVIFIATSFWINSRVPLETSILRDRNALYRVNYLGVVENTYTLKVLNKTQQALHYKISVQGLEYSNVTLPKNLLIAPGTMREIPITISIDGQTLHESITDFSFNIQAIEQPNISLQKATMFYRGSNSEYAG
ncbi:MAG: cytochrome c oxidase accessory protein CcoG [Colwellia sp.]|nr:cytochrome c oxidase accessory protein CcoG [Colwellia sp.]MCW9082606.1 cytochrome c oxidase accessory protein CcoG [Colwellia sp.]